MEINKIVFNQAEKGKSNLNGGQDISENHVSDNELGVQKIVKYFF